MNRIDYKELLSEMEGVVVDRPNRASGGTLSGHAAGEPFEKCVYHKLKEMYPDYIYKQYEYLNDLYHTHPEHITVEQRKRLFNSPTAMFLLSRGDLATRDWTPDNIFEEKQNDTADILYNDGSFYGIIDVKTRNASKSAMPPNIISAYKLAKTCSYMIDNAEYDNIDIDYIEVMWKEEGEYLKCTSTCYANLFRANPTSLYINWAAAMQIQFHVGEVDQSWENSRELWARCYIKAFVHSAEERCKKMTDKYILPFLKYIEDI